MRGKAAKNTGLPNSYLISLHEFLWTLFDSLNI